MRILLMVNKPLPEDFGTGAGTVYYTMEEIARQGHDVLYICRGRHKLDFAIRKEEKNFTVVKLPFMRILEQIALIVGVIAFRPDVVETYRILRVNFILKLLTNCKFVYHLEPALSCNKKIMKHADAILAVSGIVKDKFDMGIREKVIVTGLGVNDGMFKPEVGK